MMKAIVLGGGNDQISLIQSLKHRGYLVWMVDYNESPLAKDYSDFHIRESTLDKDAIRKIVLEIGPDMVVTACTDQSLLIAAELSEEFDIFFPLSAIQARKLTNKRYMKDVLVGSGIETSKNVILDHFDKNQIESLSLPLVFKPVDSNSSKGVIKALSENDFERCYEFSKSFSRSGQVICEEFIEGVEISIDAYVRNGQAIQLMTSISEKLSGNRNNFPICRSIIPAPISEIIAGNINVILQQIVQAFSLSNSPLLIQAIIKGNNIFVLELSARTGGGSKHHIIKYMTGVDVIEAFVDDIEMRPNEVKPKPNRNEEYIMQYIYSMPAKFGEIVGLDSLKQSGDIIDYFIYKSRGMEVHEASSSSDRCCGYLIPRHISPKSINNKFEILDIEGRIMKKIWS